MAGAARRRFDPWLAAAAIFFLAAAGFSAAPALKAGPSTLAGLLLLLGVAGVAVLGLLAIRGTAQSGDDSDQAETFITALSEPASLAAPAGGRKALWRPALSRAGWAAATFAAFAGVAHAETVKIAIAGPLTGAVAQYGDMVKEGVATAVEQINAAGGINGEKVVLKMADDAGEPKQGVSAANQLVGDGVRFVVGDAYRLPFAPARFDAAFAGFWYSHVPRARVDAFLRGLHRVLVPGARVVLPSAAISSTVPSTAAGAGIAPV